MPQTLEKAATGINGLDDVLQGGLPARRPTLTCGGPGCGKTVLAMEFLVRGAVDHGEPGLFVSFEEPTDDLIQNFAPFGFDLPGLISRGQLQLSQVEIPPAELFASGEFTLDGLFIRLEQAIAAIGAKRVVLDTLDRLFLRFADDVTLRSELARLFQWLKDRAVTAVITAERGDGALTRAGLEAYASDCVLLLDHRVIGNIAKRRLRVIKYRGSTHGLDEYPFMIGPAGMSVFPVSSVAMSDEASMQCVSSGVEDVDAMLGRGGYYRGSSVLISGTAGTGKSTLAAAFAVATCRGGDRCLYLAFEESPSQIVRNMQSVGIHFSPFVEDGSLRIHSVRPTLFGLEEHLVSVLALVDAFEPGAVVIDPMSNFVSVGDEGEIKSMLIRVFEHLKSRGITTVTTSLTRGQSEFEHTEVEVSSLMDSWIVLRHIFVGNHRRRLLHVAKSRGMGSSQEVRELLLRSDGIALGPVAPDGHSANGPPGVAP